MTAARRSSSPLRLGVVVLTLATAMIHLYLGLSAGLGLFVLNGLGYLALLAALYAPIPRLAPYGNVVRRAFVAYTALTVVLWILIGERNLIGYLDKIVEIALIALLLLERRRRQ